MHSCNPVSFFLSFGWQHRIGWREFKDLHVCTLLGLRKCRRSILPSAKTLVALGIVVFMFFPKNLSFYSFRHNFAIDKDTAAVGVGLANTALRKPRKII